MGLDKYDSQSCQSEGQGRGSALDFIGGSVRIVIVGATGPWESGRRGDGGRHDLNPRATRRPQSRWTREPGIDQIVSLSGRVDAIVSAEGRAAFSRSASWAMPTFELKPPATSYGKVNLVRIGLGFGRDGAFTPPPGIFPETGACSLPQPGQLGARRVGRAAAARGAPRHRVNVVSRRGLTGPIREAIEWHVTLEADPKRFGASPNSTSSRLTCRVSTGRRRACPCRAATAG